MGIDKWQIGILQPGIPRSPQWSPLAQGEISGRWRLHLLLPISFKPAQGEGGPTRPLHLTFIERFWERRCAVTAWNATASVPYNLNKNAADRISRSAAFLFLTGALRDYLTDLCGSMTNFLAAPLSKSLYPCGASSSEITVTFTALAI